MQKFRCFDGWSTQNFWRGAPMSRLSRTSNLYPGDNKH